MERFLGRFRVNSAQVSVQPNSGASGEYAGLLAIRAYQQALARATGMCLPHPRLGSRDESSFSSHGRAENA